jgi:hypothetical protein
MAGPQQKELLLPGASRSEFVLFQILLVVGFKFFELKAV